MRAEAADFETVNLQNAYGNDYFTLELDEDVDANDFVWFPGAVPAINAHAAGVPAAHVPAAHVHAADAFPDDAPADAATVDEVAAVLLPGI